MPIASSPRLVAFTGRRFWVATRARRTRHGSFAPGATAIAAGSTNCRRSSGTSIDVDGAPTILSLAASGCTCALSPDRDANPAEAEAASGFGRAARRSGRSLGHKVARAARVVLRGCFGDVAWSTWPSDGRDSGATLGASAAAAQGIRHMIVEQLCQRVTSTACSINSASRRPSCPTSLRRSCASCSTRMVSAPCRPGLYWPGAGDEPRPTYGLGGPDPTEAASD